MLKLTTDKHEASSSLSATAELLVHKSAIHLNTHYVIVDERTSLISLTNFYFSYCTTWLNCAETAVKHQPRTNLKAKHLKAEYQTHRSIVIFYNYFPREFTNSRRQKYRLYHISIRCLSVGAF